MDKSEQNLQKLIIESTCKTTSGVSPAQDGRIADRLKKTNTNSISNILMDIDWKSDGVVAESDPKNIPWEPRDHARI